MKLFSLLSKTIESIIVLLPQVENTKVDPENNIGNVDRLRLHLSTAFIAATILLDSEQLRVSIASRHKMKTRAARRCAVASEKYKSLLH